MPVARPAVVMRTSRRLRHPSVHWPADDSPLVRAEAMTSMATTKSSVTMMVVATLARSLRAMMASAARDAMTLQAATQAETVVAVSVSLATREETRVRTAKAASSRAMAPQSSVAKTSA
jgi:hypothetical protein